MLALVIAPSYTQQGGPVHKLHFSASVKESRHSVNDSASLTDTTSVDGQFRTDVIE